MCNFFWIIQRGFDELICLLNNFKWFLIFYPSISSIISIKEQLLKLSFASSQQRAHVSSKKSLLLKNTIHSNYSEQGKKIAATGCQLILLHLNAYNICLAMFILFFWADSMSKSSHSCFLGKDLESHTKSLFHFFGVSPSLPMITCFQRQLSSLQTSITTS